MKLKFWTETIIALCAILGIGWLLAEGLVKLLNWVFA